LDTTKFSYSNGDVIIENDVWIGSGVTIMSGVKIGNGSIVAANSHIISDVRPFSIVGGNPATFIRYRFPHEIISKLEEINWWNYDIQLNPNGLLIAQLLSSTPSMTTLDQLAALLTLSSHQIP
jgi:tetrahydrodipicolinate N-succinyltransferase